MTLLLLIACPGGGALQVDPSGPQVRAEVQQATPGPACEDPDLRDSHGPFTDITPWPELPPPAEVSFEVVPGTGGGLGVGDLDGDGQLDLYLPRATADELWSRDAEGVWSDRHPALFPQDRLWVEGEIATPVDLEGDGDTDLYVGRAGRDSLFRQGEDGQFAEVLVESGLLPLDTYTRVASFADLDSDNDLDLFLGAHSLAHILAEHFAGEEVPAPDPNLLWESHQGLFFTDITDQLLGPARRGYTWAGALLDADGDSDTDLYVVNDLGPQYAPNALMLQQSNVLVLADEAVGASVPVFGMGLGVGDLNGDAVPELLVTSWSELVLLESAPGGGWYRAEAARGLVPAGDQQLAWGASFGDVDNDGAQDLFVGYGWLVVPPEEADALEQAVGQGNPTYQPDALYQRQPDGRFTDRAPDWGLDHLGATRDGVLVDLNGDGWLDLVRRDLFGRGTVHQARCGAAAWLSVALEQEGQNREAWGARVEVLTEAGVQVRWLVSGANGGGLPAVAHFGLGEAETVAELRITWPDGAWSTLGPLDVRQHLTVLRGEELL